MNGQIIELMDKFNYISEKLTLKDVVEHGIFFNIPIYQRLYVWKDLQINTLLEDLYAAFQREEENYFLGSVMTVVNKGKFDLVDGQQRFTTLFLICKVINDLLGSETPDTVKEFCKKQGSLRLSFSIRENIARLLKDELKGIEENKELLKIPDVKNMISGMGHIKLFLEEKDHRNNLDDFAKFIVTKVVVIRTEIPEDADLNKIFELINGRGEQLSQTDILKSHILEKVRKEVFSEDKLVRYSEIWDSCSDMSDYIEFNIFRKDPNLTWKNLLLFRSDENDEETQNLDFRDDFLEHYTSLPKDNSTVASEEKTSDLLSIINSHQQKEEKDSDDDNRGHDVRSIVSFPMLLLYTLRIFLLKNKIRLYNVDRDDIDVFNEKYLLKTFSPFTKWMDDNGGRAEEFIALLWKIRVIFDRYVVKFVKTDNNPDPVLLIQKPRINKNEKKNSLSASRTFNDAVTTMNQLQSMLYFSQPRIYEHWICPFIYKIFVEQNENDLLKYLQQLDNYLLCLSHEEDMIERTYNVMKDENNLQVDAQEFKKYFSDRISDEKGCLFAHYLFYKMEYILWGTRTDKEAKRWEKYRINSKNSVEHISPQTLKYDEGHINEYNRFGNLVLISGEANSSYSNKSYKEKREAYLDKYNHGYIDSLKSDVVYQSYTEKWDNTECIQHLDDMKERAEKYFDQCSEEYLKIQGGDNRYRKWLYHNYQENRVKLIQAVLSRDPEPNETDDYFGYLPDKETLFNLSETEYVFNHNRNLALFPVEEFRYKINYYLVKYPETISMCTKNQYRIDGQNIMLLDGFKIGSHNIQELLMVIVNHLMKDSDIECTNVTNGKDYRYIHLYFRDGRIYRHKNDDSEYQSLYLIIWYDYGECHMCYQLDYNKLSHPNKFSGILKNNGWEKNQGKALYIKGKPFLCSFNNNKEYELIAKKSIVKIKHIIKSLETLSFRNNILN